jgi:putative DNA primase/helicase
MTQHTRIHDLARGRWKSILPAIGVDSRCLDNSRLPCPLCRTEKKWFRFDDKGGDGTWICNGCGAGNGVDFVMKFKGVAFLEAKKMIQEHVGSAPISLPNATKSEEARLEASREQMKALWGRARPLDGSDLGSRYLLSRGIVVDPWLASLRFIEDLPYWADNKRVLMPAILSKFLSPDKSSWILHRTYLAEPGRKADIEDPKMFMQGIVPKGGAVRLGPASETMGVAEGIETAKYASQVSGIPVWATCNSGSMIKWEPPKEARHIIIFGDLDPTFTGQAAAYTLAYRLKMEFKKKRAEDYSVIVRFTQFEDPGNISEDWNDLRDPAA